MFRKMIMILKKVLLIFTVFYSYNYIAVQFGCSIPFNFFTLLFTYFFGVSGFITLIILKFLL